LPFPKLPAAAIPAHVFPQLRNHALISIRTLCNAGCTVLFEQTSVEVRYNDKLVLEGSRVPPGLWSSNTPALHQANATFTAPRKTAAIQHLHTKPEHQPHQHNPLQYRTKSQLTELFDNSPPLGKHEILRLQQITRKFLYYSRVVDPTMNVTLSTLASQQTKATEQTKKDATKFLNYCATHPVATMQYHAPEMILKIHSDASYNSESGACSQMGGHFYLGSRTSDDDTNQGTILATTAVMQAVLSSASEAGIGAFCENTKKAAILRVTLEEMGYPQPPTLVQTDNSTACSIANDNIKQQQSRAIDMRFYWVRDRVRQGQFHIHWKPEKVNLANYYTKHHSAAHHQQVRHLYLHPESTTKSQTIPIASELNVLHRSTAHCHGFRAARTVAPTCLASHAPSHQRSQQQRRTSKMMAVKQQANRFSSFLACSIVSHPSPISNVGSRTSMARLVQ
jgi:hypothetical protein